jgi:hypothetical protein
MREDPDGYWWFLIPIVSGLIVWANAVISAPDFAMDVATISEDLSAGDKKAVATDIVLAAVPIVPAGAGKVAKSLKGAGKAGADNIANGAKLKEFYKQAEKYGTGSIKELENGKLRSYGEIKAAAKEGEMAGARLVREWDPASGGKRIWYETVDHAGNIRQVRPDPSVTGGVKTHYMFDINRNYTGSWVPKK